MALKDTQTNEEAVGITTSDSVSGRTEKVQLYSGEELKPFDGRPGAMDAFKLPSLINEQRVYRWR